MGDPSLIYCTLQDQIHYNTEKKPHAPLFISADVDFSLLASALALAYLRLPCLALEALDEPGPLASAGPGVPGEYLPES